jgi:hypothetical protein
MPESDDLYPGQGLGVIVTGVFVADLDDLTAIIRAAMPAHKVRALRLVTLGALDGCDRAELPVRRTTAARFTARRLPLEVRHCFLR